MTVKFKLLMLQRTVGDEQRNRCILSSYLEARGLSWKDCVGICTDGAPSMVVSIKGFASLVKQENPDIISTHCFLQREVLISKSLGDVLKIVFDDVIKMVNFIKQRPVHSRMFRRLCGHRAH